MNPTDQILRRLLNAAAKAAPAAADAAPLGLETRVLARWRAAGTGDESLSLLVFLRRAMLGATLVLALSAAWSLTRSTPNTPGEDAALLDYNIQMSLNP
jgi:hypothetical protein